MDFSRYKARMEWFDGDSSEQRIFNKPGTYGLNYIDSVGCENAIDILVNQCSSPMYIPNSFTPNYDGNNDSFGAKGVNVSEYQLQIYNRWGDLIFTSDNISKEWDGYYQGRPAPQDVYSWKLLAQGTDDEIFETLEFKYDVLATRLRELAFLNKGLILELIDERQLDEKGKVHREIFHSEGGLKEFVQYLDASRQRLIEQPIHVIGEESNVVIEAALQYNTSYSENISSQVRIW